jgi:hypothetical protein
MSMAAIACVASPLRPTDAPAQTSLVQIRWMSLGSSPMSSGAFWMAWAY